MNDREDNNEHKKRKSPLSNPVVNLVTGVVLGVSLTWGTLIISTTYIDYHKAAVEKQLIVEGLTKRIGALEDEVF